MTKNNKIAVVTGASRGIGAATARMLGEKGYIICVNYQEAKAAAAEQKAAVEAAIKKATAAAVVKGGHGPSKR